MFTVITRTSGRPRFFEQCRRSVLMQTEPAYHIVISDDPADEYMEGDLVLRVPHIPGRGHNLYFNQVRQHIPPSHPWVIFLDDDDRFLGPFSLDLIRDEILKQVFTREDCLYLWQVEFTDERLIPGNAFGQLPQPGNISGIGFCYHSKHWEDWKGEAMGDFHVINALYSRLNPVWIEAVLTGVQEIGHGLKMDLTT